MHGVERRHFAPLRHRWREFSAACCVPISSRATYVALACAAFGMLLGASVAVAAPPALSTSASASPSATCQQATVNLAVTGVGDPNVQRAPLDVMIVFDRSSSMDDAGGNPPQPISSARSGAKTLVNSLTTGTDRAGLTTFSSDATLNQALTSTLTTVNTSIDNISVSGNTNIADGVRNGQSELAAHGRSSPTVRVLVVLTDGVANRRTNGGSCPNTPTSANACTQDAISKAADAKAAGTYVFTIGLNLSNLSSSTAAVARSTLQQMASNSSSYFESPTAAQLSGIFAQIGSIITTLAGSNIVVTHVLPSGVSYLSGSSTPAPTSVVGQTLTWNLGLLNIGSSSNISFGVSVNPPNANQAINVVPPSRVDYANYQSVASSVAFPLATVSVNLCATPTPTSTLPPTQTPTETSTPTLTPTSTITPTETITPTATITATATITPTTTATSTPSETETPVPVCGDGTIDPGESCDDGNTIDGDGCDSDCTPSTACTLIYPGTERFVGGCGAPSHPDIQAAIDAAADGETITVCPGTYTQSVHVTKQVRIRATTAGTVTVHTVGTAFDVARSGVDIEQLTIQSDNGSAISADDLCPLGQATCPSPGHGSNLTIGNNTILDSPIGIGWQRRIDCAQVLNNTLTDNAEHIVIQQQEGPPAVLVSVVDNNISGGGTGGAAVSLSGIAVTIAANTVALSKGNGVVVTNVVGGGATQIIENNIRKSSGAGIEVGPGADGVHIHDNNVTGNAIGLDNLSGSGILDATENWWNSQTGPSGLFAGHGDSIVNASGSTTEFIEFLCKPFPQGFPSVLGLCSVETAELTQLVPGRAPDVDKLGKFITFESVANMDVDPRTTYANADGSQEVYLLNRRPRPKLGGVCLGGLLGCDLTDLSLCTHCTGRNQCPGDPSSDPIVLNGECVLLTQLSNGAAGSVSSGPRLSGLVNSIVYDSDTDPAGGNGDGSREVVGWQRSLFEKSQPSLSVYSNGVDPVSYEDPSPSRNGKVVVMESNGDPLGENPDGNTEIFIYKPKVNEWVQVTHTLPPVENHRPVAPGGGRILFDSTGDLNNDPNAAGINNADGNRELFVARVRGAGTVFRQITNTVAPADSLSGSFDSKSVVAAFSSTGDLVGQNADGNREIYTWSRRTNTIEQLTHSIGGENANPTINLTQRYVVFESTSDLTSSGATNRRVFQFDRLRGELLLLSRSRFGTNQVPRISQHRFVVWESTGDLTGNNPQGDWVIYIFDRKKD